jgi:hypothetical protein
MFTIDNRVWIDPITYVQSFDGLDTDAPPNSSVAGKGLTRMLDAGMNLDIQGTVSFYFIVVSHSDDVIALKQGKLNDHLLFKFHSYRRGCTEVYSSRNDLSTSYMHTSVCFNRPDAYNELDDLQLSPEGDFASFIFVFVTGEDLSDAMASAAIIIEDHHGIVDKWQVILDLSPLGSLDSNQIMEAGHYLSAIFSPGPEAADSEFLFARRNDVLFHDIHHVFRAMSRFSVALAKLDDSVSLYKYGQPANLSCIPCSAAGRCLSMPRLIFATFVVDERYGLVLKGPLGFDFSPSARWI